VVGTPVSRLTLSHNRQSVSVAIVGDAIVFGNTANSVEIKNGWGSPVCGESGTLSFNLVWQWITLWMLLALSNRTVPEVVCETAGR
jgi:hypothetical protein